MSERMRLATSSADTATIESLPKWICQEFAKVAEQLIDDEAELARRDAEIVGLRTSLIRACDATIGRTIGRSAECVSSDFLEYVGAEVEGYIADLKQELARCRMDAERWRRFLSFLRSGRIPKAGHGLHIKLIRTCPMFGDETELHGDELTTAIDAAMDAR